MNPPAEEIINRVYRRLLIAEICLVVAIIPLTFFSVVIFESVSGDTRTPPIDNGLIGFIFGASCIIFMIGIAANIVAWIGLFKYRLWARWLYLGVHISMRVIGLPFQILDTSSSWGLVSFLSDAGSLVTGAILAIMFLSPVANRFVSISSPDTK